MKYTGASDFSHGDADRIGILLTNLGTPDAPTPRALRRYLKEFLWDPRVVEMPRPLWWLILNGIILNIRPRRSAAAYAQVWTDEGSPLMHHARSQAQALSERLAVKGEGRVLVELAMRYGNPSISSVLSRLQQAGVRRLLVLPLYPQYSAATTASTFDALAADFTRRRWLPDLRFVSHYHDFPPYIEAMAEAIREHWAQKGRAQRLLFSFHGIPRDYLLKGDPYYCECMKTSRLLAQRLQLNEGEYLTTFQSRFGRQEWLQPYTDATLKALPGRGCDRFRCSARGSPLIVWKPWRRSEWRIGTISLAREASVTSTLRRSTAAPATWMPWSSWCWGRSSLGSISRRTTLLSVPPGRGNRGPSAEVRRRAIKFGCSGLQPVHNRRAARAIAPVSCCSNSAEEAAS